MSEEKPILSYFARLQKIKLGQLPKEAVKKTPKAPRKVSLKKEAENKAAKEKGSDSELDKFFDKMLRRCTGKCFFCGGKTTAIDTKFWRDDNSNWSKEANDKKHERTIETMKRASVAHLLPKRPVDKGGFPSQAANEDNWIELCLQCHTSFDQNKITWLTLKDSKEWDVLKEKLLNVLPLVTPLERQNKLYHHLTELVYGK